MITIEADKANKKEKTGTEWYAYHLIVEMSQLPEAKQRDVLLYSRDVLDIPYEPSWKSKVLKWWGKGWSQIRLSFALWLDKPSLLFVPSHTIPLFHRCKTITTLHDVGFLRQPELYSWWERLYHTVSSYIALRFASKVITVSGFSQKEICFFYPFAKAKLQVIYNGYDKDRFIPGIPSLEVLGIHKPYVLYVGRLEEKKNIERIVESFISLKKDPLFSEYECVLVGKKGYGWEKVEPLVKSHSFFHCLEYVSATTLPSLYQGASLFLFPTLYEGFGIPLLEAMGCGVPVVTSVGGAHQEIVGDAGLLVEPLSVFDIKRGMQEVLSKPQIAQSLREKGLERVKSFSWERCAKETWDAIKTYENSL